MCINYNPTTCHIVSNVSQVLSTQVFTLLPLFTETVSVCLILHQPLVNYHFRHPDNELDLPKESLYSKLRDSSFGLDKLSKALETGPKHNYEYNQLNNSKRVLVDHNVNLLDPNSISEPKQFPTSSEYMPLCMRPMSFNESDDVTPERPTYLSTNPFLPSSSSLKPHFIFNDLNIKASAKPQNLKAQNNIFGDQEMQEMVKSPEKSLLETNFDEEQPKTDFIKTVGVPMPGMVSNQEFRRSMGNLLIQPIHPSQAVPMNAIETPTAPVNYPNFPPTTPVNNNDVSLLTEVNPHSKSTDIF